MSSSVVILQILWCHNMAICQVCNKCSGDICQFCKVYTKFQQEVGKRLGFVHTPKPNKDTCKWNTICLSRRPYCLKWQHRQREYYSRFSAEDKTADRSVHCLGWSREITEDPGLDLEASVFGHHLLQTYLPCSPVIQTHKLHSLCEETETK